MTRQQPGWARVVVVLIAVALSACRSGGPTATFVQITDLHLFDEGKLRELPGQPASPDYGLWRDDERAFDAALRTIGKLRALKFVVFTGDLGLEMTGPYWESQAVDYFARKLSGLPVSHILFVPGNNDLLSEEPRDIGRYRHFVSELGAKIKQTVVDLSRTSVVIGGLSVHGLDSTSFKNSVSCRLVFRPLAGPVLATTMFEAPKGSPVPSLLCKDKDIAERLTHQRHEMDRLDAEVAKHGERIQLIFTHIPPLEDPFQKANEPPPWNLEPSARRTWDTLVPKVRCVFAGHFHTDQRRHYGRGGAGGTCQNGDVVVAPPLAIKFQDDGKKIPARGLLTGTITPGGAISYDILWYPTDLP
jgi:hypothetical protein